MLHEQIKWMTSIYACSYFTIAAASGSDSQIGLPGVASPRQPHRDLLDLNGFAKFIIHGYSWNKEEDTYNLRAWTFQEWLLSSRFWSFIKTQTNGKLGREPLMSLSTVHRKSTRYLGTAHVPKAKCKTTKF